MKRVNCSELKRNIRAKIDRYPLELNYSNSNDPFPRKVKESYDYLGKQIQINGTWSWIQRKKAFIYYVIFEQTFHIDEGRKLKVSPVEINETFTKYTYMLEVVEKFEYSDEFFRFLFKKAKEVIVEEKAELKKFQSNGSFLNRLLGSYDILNHDLQTMKRVASKLIEIDNKMKDAISKWEERILSGNELDEIRKDLDSARSYYRDYLDHLIQKYKQKSELKRFKRRRILKGCFKSSELKDEQSTNIPTLKFNNISTLNFLIEEYCKWFNDKFRNEIVAERQKKIPSKREIEYKNRCELLKPYMKSTLSLSKIAREVGLSKTICAKNFKNITRKLTHNLIFFHLY